MQVSTIQEDIKTKQKQLQQCKQKSFAYSRWRALLFCVALFAMFRAYYYETMFYLLCAAAFVIFLVVAYKHKGVKQEIEDHETMLEVLMDLLARKGNEWKAFADTGEEFLTEDATQAYDLDLFGASSLYQYLSVAKTFYGRARLAQLLSVQMQKQEDIKMRGEAVQECATQNTFTWELTKLLKLYAKHGQRKKEASMEDVLTYMEEDTALYPPLVRFLCAAISGCTLLALLCYGLGLLNYAPVLVLATLSICSSILLFLRHAAYLEHVQPLIHLIADYERIFALIANTEFTSKALMHIREDVGDAQKAIQRLRRIVMMVQLRSNSILFFIVNAFALLDVQCVMALQEWKACYGKQLRNWLLDIADLEAYASLAQLNFAKEHCCIAQVKGNDVYLEANKLYHPLLKEDTAVENSIVLHQGTYIITGSNMSGKTTFLRTLGINLVLMHAGASVCAKSFAAGSMHLYTSMRVHDNVSEGISTFYAEILRIQKMNEASVNQEPMLVLIDEIFKGTNSADRIICATSAIRHLHKPWIITMISTHDFELCELQNDAAIQAHNYHFREYYEDGNICFDYLLRDGKCTTTNARALMKLAGFQEEL